MLRRRSKRVAITGLDDKDKSEVGLTECSQTVQ